MNLIAIGILFILAFILQYVFTFFQMNDFKKRYKELKSKGRVVIGRRKGAMRAGAIVLICIDEDDKVIETAYMQGVTVLSRFKKFDGFNGLKVHTISESDCKALKLSKSLTKSVIDGVDNFKTIMSGEEVEMPDSPLKSLTKLVKINN